VVGRLTGRFLVLAIALGAGCRHETAAPSAASSPMAAPASTGPGEALSGAPLYSQHREELIVRDFFHDRRNGVFLDVGCASPIQNSNTYYLE